ncbi:MAG: hypothetical protein WBQ24_21455 [Xanthobacteraceae bacterium]
MPDQLARSTRQIGSIEPAGVACQWQASSDRCEEIIGRREYSGQAVIV